MTILDILYPWVSGTIIFAAGYLGLALAHACVEGELSPEVDANDSTDPASIHYEPEPNPHGGKACWYSHDANRSLYGSATTGKSL